MHGNLALPSTQRDFPAVPAGEPKAFPSNLQLTNVLGSTSWGVYVVKGRKGKSGLKGKKTIPPSS